MALVDTYNIVHDMTLSGQNVLNVYQVVRTSGIEAAATISDGFQNSILPVLRLFQATTLTNNELRIFNLGVSTDFGTFPIAAPGLRAGFTSPSFMAGELRFPSRDRNVRSGFKRFRGALETDYSGGVLEAATVTLLENIGDALIAPWLSSIDAHAICNFVIVKRVCTVTPPPDEPCPSYRLPESDGELLLYQPNVRVVIPTIRSQVSSRVPAS